MPDDPPEFFKATHLFTSPDGIHWRRSNKAVLPFRHDTQNMFFFDRRLGRYVAYVRWGTERIPGYGWANRCVARVEFDDPMDLPWPCPIRRETGQASQPEEANVVGLDKPLPKPLEWRTGALPLVMFTDDCDPADTDVYIPAVHQYPWADDSYYLSFANLYRHQPYDHDGRGNTNATGFDGAGRENDGPLEVQLHVSADGIQWARPDRRPYVGLGCDGEWDAGVTYMVLGMIRKGNEIWQYYTGGPWTHGWWREKKRAGVIGRLVQRLDGFISADFDYRGGEFATPLIKFSGSQLQLNVDCSAMGEVWVEVRDERGIPVGAYKPIPAGPHSPF